MTNLHAEVVVNDDVHPVDELWPDSVEDDPGAHDQDDAAGVATDDGDGRGEYDREGNVDDGEEEEPGGYRGREVDAL